MLIILVKVGDLNPVHNSTDNKVTTDTFAVAAHCFDHRKAHASQAYENSLVFASLASVSSADNGDVAIYRESSVGNTLTTSNFNNNWDTIQVMSCASIDNYYRYRRRVTLGN